MLLVDDEPWFQRPLIAVLEHQDVVCVQVQCVEDALAYAREHHVQVLVTDIMMPAGSSYPRVDSTLAGYFLADEMRKLHPNIAIVFLSVISDTEKIRELKASGARYIQKGVLSLNRVVEIVKKAARRS